jgi:small subunit ribosomal protein S2
MEIDQKKIQDMMQNGLHYGHKKNKTHPKAAKFVLPTKNNIEVMNLEITYTNLMKAIEMIQNTINNNGLVLFVSTLPSARDCIKDIAKSFNQPYVVNRWIGGLLTNYKTISERVKHYVDMKNKFNDGEFEKYTKREQVKIERELDKLEEKFGGLVNMHKKPELVFVIDPRYHKTAVIEANSSHMDVIAILDNDDDPTKITCPIPANDSSVSSISYILGEIKSNVKTKNSI